jgi:hypothetical protein
MSGPSLVTRIYGEVTGDGAGISLQLQTRESIVQVTLAKGDIGGLVFMLLTLVTDDGTRTTDRPSQLRNHLPADKLWVGEDSNGNALLGLEIGGTKLTFGLPREQLQRLGQAFLCASAPTKLAT